MGISFFHKTELTWVGFSKSSVRILPLLDQEDITPWLTEKKLSSIWVCDSCYILCLIFILHVKINRYFITLVTLLQIIMKQYWSNGNLPEV